MDSERLKDANILMDDNQGGFLVPEVMTIDVPRAGWFWKSVRWAGSRLMDLGAKIKFSGFYKKEIHPQADLMRMLDEMRTIKNGR